MRVRGMMHQAEVIVNNEMCDFDRLPGKKDCEELVGTVRTKQVVGVI